MMPLRAMRWLGALLFIVAMPSWAQIQVSSANPSAAAQGTINLNVTVSGNGFKKGAKAQWFVSGTTNPGGVTVNSTTFNGSTQLTANITVSSSAVLSGYDIQVMNSDGRTGVGTELFTVNSTNSGSCTSQNPAVNVVFAPGNSGQRLIYGDSDNGSTSQTYNNPNDAEFNGGTVYSGGVFNVCSGSNDLTLNLNSTPRFINTSFFQLLSSPQAGAVDVTNQTYPMVFLNLRNAYSLQTVGGGLNTCLFSDVNYTNSTTFHVRFESTSLYGPQGTTCPNDAVGQAANYGGSTSVIAVTHPDSCTWLVHPVADSSGYSRGGLVETIHKQTLSGGQYNLPFAMKVVLASCPL